VFAFLIFFVLLILFVFLMLSMLLLVLLKSSDSLQILFGMLACNQVNFKVLLDEVLEGSSTHSASS
jgi:hypothetical protein